MTALLLNYCQNRRYPNHSIFYNDFYTSICIINTVNVKQNKYNMNAIRFQSAKALVIKFIRHRLVVI